MSIEKIYSLKDIDVVAKALCDTFRQYKIWVFTGDLGAGKTTLIQSMCKYLEVRDVVNSPSFSIVQIYETLENPIYHIDLYRLKSLDEALNIGIEEMLESKDFCFIEWPQIIDLLLKRISHIRIEINSENEDVRKLKIIV